MAERAVVFGGAGFIGSHLLKALSASGRYDRLVSVDIRPPRFATAGVHYLTGDVRERISADLCPGVTEIYNLAAVHTTPGHEDWEYYYTNCMGATHVCDYARANGVRSIVFTSSIAVYGPTEAEKNEQSPLEPESAYGKSKQCAEEIHRQWQADGPPDAGRELVIVRPAVIYGYKEGGNFTRLAGLLKRGRFFFPGRTDTIKACGYVEDLVRSIMFAKARHEPLITYNFASPRKHSSKEICDAFSRVAGYAPANRVIPLGGMLAVGAGFEVLNVVGLKTSINRARIMKLNKSTNITPKWLMDHGFDYAFDLDGSLKSWQGQSKTGDFE